MRLTVLGSSGTFAGPDDACSGYLVEHDGFRLLMDAGPGTLSNLQQHVPLDRLDAVLLSHAHPDHWTELPTLCNAFRFVLGRDDLPVIGPQEVLTCLEEAFGAPVSPTFALEEAADGDEFDLGPIELRCSATDHPGNTLAFHMSAGEAAIAYSADTGPGWSFKEFNAPITLGVCEASYLDDADTGGLHLSAAQAGNMARDADVPFLSVTHIVPGQDRTAIEAAAADAFGSEVHMATPTFDLNCERDFFMTPSPRADGRANDELRAISFERDATEFALGSVMAKCGHTWVLCTVSLDEDVPRWMRGRGSGWVTAEYSMLPGSSPERIRRETKGPKGRTQEIQRLIGRSLRAVVDHAALGERQLLVDCDVLQADGGTRTTSITGAWLALWDACERLVQAGLVESNPISQPLAAVSVGLIDGEARLDLPYEEDSRAEVDMNVVVAGDGRFVEVQGTAEGSPFSRAQLDELMALAEGGAATLFEHQRRYTATRPEPRSIGRPD